MRQQPAGPSETRFPPGFAATYTIDLLYEDEPIVTADAVGERLRVRLPESTVETVSGQHLAVVHHGHHVELRDARGPAMHVVMPGGSPAPPDELARALEQTWTWPREQAQALLLRSRHRLVVGEMMAQALPYRDRLSLFHAVVAATAASRQPLVCHWRPAAGLIHEVDQSDDPLSAALNVRLFNVQASDDTLVMDTMGLAALGLPDVQCHFRGIEPGRMAGFLQAVGRYLFEQGDVIEDGHTLPGVGPDERWRCRHELALVAPERVVLNVEPGDQYRPAT